MGLVQGLRKTIIAHENLLVFAFMITFALAMVGYSLQSSFQILSTSGFTITLDTVLVVLSFTIAIVVSYFMLKSFGQERHIQFFDGEEVILSSTSSGTYAQLMSVGDSDVHEAPLHSNIYLTNFGIVVEPKNTGDIMMFVPYDMIRHFRPHLNGILVRSIDIKGQFNETLFIVDDRQSWLEAIASSTSQNMV